ncbi:MAG: hypothetical protein ACR2OZ_20360 [Verrucomicrobiales bacterium]
MKALHCLASRPFIRPKVRMQKVADILTPNRKGAGLPPEGAGRTPVIPLPTANRPQSHLINRVVAAVRVEKNPAAAAAAIFLKKKMILPCPTQ